MIAGDREPNKDAQVIKRADDRKDFKNSYVEYKVPGKGLARFFKTEQKRGLIVNLSKSGFAFRTDAPLPEGTKMSATLSLAGGKAHLQVKLEIRWAREERKVGTMVYTHLVGARFTEYSPEAWEGLNKVLKE